MDKKYYSVKYSEDLNIGELKIIGTAWRGQYEPSVSKLVRNYKDELYDGHGLKLAFKNGNKESLSSIVDANVTTLIVAIILFIFGAALM